MEEVRLLVTWPSLFSYRIIWALKLKGVEYEYIEENLSNKSEILLKSNPIHKKIPVLIHNGKPIAESSVILEYIEETCPNNPLLPSHPFLKAQARFWINFGQDKGSKFVKVFHTVGKEQEKAIEEAKEVLQMIENYAFSGANKFFNGEKVGLTDIVFGWFAGWLPAFEETGGVKIFDRTSFPKIQAWIENFKNDDVIKENLPNHDELVLYLSKKVVIS